MDDRVGAVLAIYGVVLIFALIICIAVYVIDAYGMTKVYKAAGIDNGWMAFVPMLNFFPMAKLVVQICLLPDWLVWVLGFGWVSSFIPVVGFALAPIWSITFVVLLVKMLIDTHAGVASWVTFFIFRPAFGFVFSKDVDKFMGEQ